MTGRNLVIRTALAAGAAILVAAAGQPAGVAAAAPAAQGCTAWTTVSQTYPSTGYPFGGSRPVDTSIRLSLQFQRCTFGPDMVKHYRLAVTNLRASGKTDVAVGLKDGPPAPSYGGPSCGYLAVPDRVYGAWHPRVAAGTTWDSPAANATGREHVHAGFTQFIWGDIHVRYPSADFYGATDGCRGI